MSQADCRTLADSTKSARLPQAMRHWTLTTLREKLIGAKVVRHSRKIVFQMAEVAV
jgi:hypothetical protein